MVLILAMTCPENSVYNPAIVGCPRTCADPEGNSKCEAIPQEGCECKEGHVLSGGRCVVEDDCGCFYNDQYFPVSSLTEFKLFTSLKNKNNQYKYECLKYDKVSLSLL